MASQKTPKPRTKIKRLISLGIDKDIAYGETHVRNIGALHVVLYFIKPSTLPIGKVEGLMSIKTRYDLIRQT